MRKIEAAQIRSERKERATRAVCDVKAVQHVGKLDRNAHDTAISIHNLRRSKHRSETNFARLLPELNRKIMCACMRKGVFVEPKTKTH